jgi:acetolactate synthase-1/2/3 large subunit
MAPADSPRSGGRILIDQLRAQGVARVFCVPGESYLAALDALYDSPEIALTVCRHEGGAAMMADAYGKLTGNPASASSRAGRVPPTPVPAFTSPFRTRRR